MIHSISHYELFGITLISYLGFIALLSFSITALIAVRRKKGTRFPLKWHRRLATISICFTFIHAILGILGGHTIELSVAETQESQHSAEITDGAEVFNHNCVLCHRNGENIINPNKPIRGSFKLADIETFIGFIRNPVLPDGSKTSMPSYSQTKIPDEKAKNLYKYITSEHGLNLKKQR
jgi:mono/diheme cytochrome c family protein